MSKIMTRGCHGLRAVVRSTGIVGKSEIRIMPAQLADEDDRRLIRRFAANPGLVRVTKTTQYDLLAHDLTKEEICQEIVTWVDGGNKVKKVLLRGDHAGSPAFEMKPRINNAIYYLKVTLCDVNEDDEYMLLISAHPDH
jgi:hypothetical protein